MICYICRNEVLLPVETVCFPCFQMNQIHCNSFVRLCLFCAVHYFQLNMDYYERDLTRKCLTCHETVFSSQLKFSNTLKFDFQMMRHDERKFNCPFCEAHEGTMIELVHHLKTCDEFMHECKCKKLIPKRKLLRSHLFNCLHYRYCIDCNEFIEKEKYSNHKQSVHNYIECMFCKSFCTMQEIFEHEFYCQERPVECFYCKKNVRNEEIHAHYQEHEKVLLDRIHDEKETLRKSVEELLLLQNLRRNIFDSNLLR